MEEKKLTADDILKAVEKVRTEPFGEEDRRVVVRYDDLCAVIYRLQAEKEEIKNEYAKLDIKYQKLQAENEELKSPKFASWKIKFYRVQTENERLLEENINLKNELNNLLDKCDKCFIKHKKENPKI